jgi:TPR repeat protein
MTDKAMLATLERVLNRFLPQVQFLADSKALFERGLMLISDKSVLRDFDEAAQCFRKAAEQGHAGAQMNLGLLCEQGKGVPKDFAEAMRWYLKAAAQKELHASCHVADLYRYGKGVNVDPDEAAKWYKKEVEEQCTAAQFNLASICEEQRKMPEALTWYRRAAEGADSGPRTAAQAHLGELLSEGFFTTADYVEAWQWLTLAASGGDELSGIRLRRLKAKMTDEQLGEAGKRTEAFEKRLEEKGKKQGK